MKIIEFFNENQIKYDKFHVIFKNLQYLHILMVTVMFVWRPSRHSVLASLSKAGPVW